MCILLVFLLRFLSPLLHNSQQVDIPNFSDDIDIKGFFDWLIEVDKSFVYTEFPKDKKVKFVAYKLKGRASVWWDRLREMRMREGCGPVQTCYRMKPLLQGRFLPLDYEQYIFLCLSEMYK